MTITASGLRLTVDQMLDNGNQVRFRYFNEVIGAGSYDDDIVLTQSGNDLYTSGLLFPIGDNSQEALMLQQGWILNDDRVLYINGNIDTSGVIKIGLGSNPVGEEYQPVQGIQSQFINDETVYKKLFIRIITTGSLFGEDS